MFITFLNEHSSQVGATSRFEARASFERFVDILIEIRKIAPQLAVVADVPLLRLPIGDLYSVSEWLSSSTHERRGFMLGLANRAPFSSIGNLRPELPGDLQARFAGAPFDGLEVVGIGLAYFYNSLALSLDLHQGWQIPNVPIIFTELTSSAVISEGSAEVIHVSLLSHCALHRSSIIALSRSAVQNASAIWLNRSQLMPGLRFLPRVQSDLDALQAAEFGQVRGWLFKMNDCVESWIASGNSLPEYPPHTSDEAERRKQIWWIRDGHELRCFSWHGRYTPGAGRIHFMLSMSERKVVIGYIGLKRERPPSG